MKTAALYGYGAMLFAACLLLAATPFIFPVPARAGGDGAIENYLELSNRPDGKCQGLDRGKAVTLANRHPTATIRYRLARYLSNRRQAGLTTGSIAPATEEGKEEKLGCELIDGLKQEWRVVRARPVEQ